MAECFCGCGREVRFMDRGMNKQGHRTVELIAKLQAIREEVAEKGPLTEEGDIGPLLSHLDSLIDEGETFEGFWMTFMHVAPPPTREARRIKREWEDWGKRGMRLHSHLSLPRDVQLELLRRSAGK